LGSAGQNEDNFLVYKDKIESIEQKMKLLHQKSLEVQEISRQSLITLEECLKITEENVMHQLDKEAKLKLASEEHKKMTKKYDVNWLNNNN